MKVREIKSRNTLVFVPIVSLSPTVTLSAEVAIVFCDTQSRAMKLIEARSFTPALKRIVIFFPESDLEELRSKSVGEIEIVAFSDVLVRHFSIFIK